VLVFPRDIPVTVDAPLTPFLEKVELGMESLRERPVFLAWGMKDPIFTPDFIDAFWKRTFPDADVLRLPEASHYLQEDAHDELVPALLTFLQKIHRQEHEATDSRRLQTETVAS
jgi:haloalkane dehalogenase